MAPAERAAIVGKFADIYASKMMEMADLITTEMGSPITFSQLAQAPTPWLMLNFFVNLSGTFPWEEKRQGVLAARRAGPPRARRRGRRHRPVERAPVRHHGQAGAIADRRLHHGPQAVPGDTARRLLHGRDARGGRPPPRRAQHRARRAARSASTWSATATSTRSRSPARRLPAGASPASAASSSSG